MISLYFLVVDTQLYTRFCPFVGPFVGPSVCPLVRGDRVGKCENAHFSHSIMNVQLVIDDSVLFLVGDTQLYKRLCPFVGSSVRLLVRGDRVGKCENVHFIF